MVGFVKSVGWWFCCLVAERLYRVPMVGQLWVEVEDRCHRPAAWREEYGSTRRYAYVALVGRLRLVFDTVATEKATRREA